MENQRFHDITDRFKGKRIAVAGDLMLDVYLWGRVSRISPEAPVPVVNIARRTSCLGGAGNVLRNINTLGGDSVAFGIVGDDRDGDELCRQLESYGIDCSYVTADTTRRTTNKERVVAGTQQLLRIDYEDTFPVSEELRNAMTGHICRLIENGELDAVIFEDYAKGVLSGGMLEQIMAAAKAHGVITALDPKPGNISPVKGLTVMKPNRKEAYIMAGMNEPSGKAPIEELDMVAERIRRDWEPEYLLISLASEGMALYNKDGHRAVIPTFAREVFDVSGAGDTVVAAFTLALTAGAEPEEAAAIGNYAAGVVVGKVGTVTVSAQELKEQF